MRRPGEFSLHHQLHETLEVTHGFTNYFECAGYAPVECSQTFTMGCQTIQWVMTQTATFTPSA